MNNDASLDWLVNFRIDYNLHMPIMQNADEACDAYHLGREYRTLPPLFMVIDKEGMVRHRSLGRGSISIEAVAELVAELLEE